MANYPIFHEITQPLLTTHFSQVNPLISRLDNEIPK
jgi:hypothetical protein